MTYRPVGSSGLLQLYIRKPYQLTPNQLKMNLLQLLNYTSSVQVLTNSRPKIELRGNPHLVSLESG